MAAGSQLRRPISSDSSIDGIMSDHTEAATITPAAKPMKIFWVRSSDLLRVKSTVEAPTSVPANGINIIDSQLIIH